MSASLRAGNASDGALQIDGADIVLLAASGISAASGKTLTANAVSPTGVYTVNEVTDNDGSFDLSAANDFKCTPTANFTLTFTNIPASPIVQKGTVILVNTGGYTVSAHTNTKVGTSTLTTITASGTYELAYRTSNGVAYVTASGALS